MTYLTALASVLAIVAIVIVGGVIVTFLGKQIINIFDSDKKLNDSQDIQTEVESFNTYNSNHISDENKKTVENTNDIEEDYNYTDVNNAMAEVERKKLEEEMKSSGEDHFFDDYKSNLESENEDKEVDDFDLMSMIDEISGDVLDEENKANEEKAKEESENSKSILDKYSIDSVLSDEDDEDDIESDIKEVKSNQSVVDDESLEEFRAIRDEIKVMLDEIKSSKSSDEETKNEEEIEQMVAEKVDEKIDENLRTIEQLKETLQAKEEEISQINDSKKELENKFSEINRQIVNQMNEQNREIENNVTKSATEINELKAQLAELSKQLEEERSANWKVAHNTVKQEETKPVEKTIKVVDNDVIDITENETENDDSDDENGSLKVEKDESEEPQTVADDILDEITEQEVDSRVEEQTMKSTTVVHELTKKVEEVTGVEIAHTEKVVVFQYSTEEQYLNRIAVLEERLRVAKKDLKINDKEYKPLERIKRRLAKDTARLRRKNALAANKKINLYGVNNYVDLDKEKAEKLARELELLDGLRLSVTHCEEVVAANADRYPILEHTHNILTNNINDLESDLAQLNKELKALREKESGDKE